MLFMAAEQPSQNVHSYVQMKARPVAESGWWHFSHSDFIKRAIGEANES
jgi:hypothetical protein